MKKTFKLIFLSIVPFLFAANCKSQYWKGLGLKFDYGPRCLYADSAGGKLYIGGEFNKVNGQVTGGLISYDGTNWDSLPGNPLGYPIHDITKFQGKIYAGGTNGLASWDGMKWECIDCGIGAKGVWALHVYQNQLLVGGGFTNIGGTGLHTLAAWDGSSFSDFIRKLTPQSALPTWQAVRFTSLQSGVEKSKFPSAGSHREFMPG